ncbi:MAG: ATP-grasp domain-containing protein, partial [Bradymonadaceae bacterium]
ALALDKGRSKALFESAGIVTPSSGRIQPGEAAEMDEAGLREWLRRRELEAPAVVKPTDGGSSQGVTIRESFDGILASVREIGDEASEATSAGVLVEEYVDGPEYTVGLFDGECLGSLEVIPGEDFYDYHAKYESDETQYE